MQSEHNLARLRQYAERLGFTDMLTPEVEAGARIVTYQAGQMIMETGDAIHHILILVEGSLRVYSISERGKLGIVALAKPPQLLGDIEYMQEVNALHSVRAETKATLISFPIADVQNYLSGSITFYRMICNNLIDKLYKTSGDYSRTLLYPAKNLFARYLLDRMDSECLVRFSASEASQNLGITPRHMSRLITALEQDQILRRERTKVLRILAPDALEELTYL
jgi:CRP-like cAMP-binding protein